MYLPKKVNGRYALKNNEKWGKHQERLPKNWKNKKLKEPSINLLDTIKSASS